MARLTKKQQELNEWQDKLKVESEYRNNFHRIVLDYLATISQEEAFKHVFLYKDEGKDLDWLNNKGGLVFNIYIRYYGCDDNELIGISICELFSLSYFEHVKFEINSAISDYNYKKQKEIERINLKQTALSKLTDEEKKVLGL